MLKKLWRNSHLGLALVSSIFLILATVTGFILAFEPIQKELQPYEITDAQKLPLAQVLDTLSEKYEEILEIKVDKNDFVTASVISMEEDLNGDFYINPFTGEKIADIPSQSAFFEWTTNFHRSLFLKSTGRFIVGIVSFLLFLITVTGILLLIERQGGIRFLFSTIVKDDFYQYYHIVLSRWALVPIIIISLTGAYLSLLRFEVIPESNVIISEHNLQNDSSEVSVFETITLGEIKKLEFPFTDEADDYFILSLKDKELKVNQQNGAIVEVANYPFIASVSTLSFNLHTGTGSIIWSLILAIAALNILFFLYSGIAIAYRRLRSNIKNTYLSDEAEYVILVGSENGTTKKFGKVLQEALLQLNQKVFLDELNNYQSYPNLKDLIILTSTYGDGEAPVNATDFLKKNQSNPILENANYAVVGFGSLAYPNFCQYALDIDKALSLNTKLTKVTEPYLIHNQSFISFETWAETWSKVKGLPLNLPALESSKRIKKYKLEVVHKECINDDYSETFLLKLKTDYTKFQSGDLLGIIPPNDLMERWYSIAKVSRNTILLSIKRHEFGLCSNFLYQLKTGDSFNGIIQKNKDFHFPKKSKEVILIGNGTGIAPFLGMLQEAFSNRKVSLFWGGRTTTSYQLYEKLIEQAQKKGSLTRVEIAYSKECSDYKYVQDIVRKESLDLVQKLNSGATIMICGAIAMQNDVLKILEQSNMELYEQKLNIYQQKGQILMDCY